MDFSLYGTWLALYMSTMVCWSSGLEDSSLVSTEERMQSQLDNFQRKLARLEYMVMKSMNPKEVQKAAEGNYKIAAANKKRGKRGRPGPPGPPGTTEGSVYTRWGRKSCGSDSTLIYEGYAGGTHYRATGGGVNYQCMPLIPEHDDRSAGSFHGTIMYGTEYETFGSIFHWRVRNNNVPCARCYTKNRPAHMMIPANRNCPNGWTKEYEGYLMTGRQQDDGPNFPATFECVDAYPEFVDNSQSDNNGALFYFMRPDCITGGHCPSYDAAEELTCVVCSR